MVKRDMLLLKLGGLLICREWLLELDVMSDKGLLMRRMRKMKIWLLLLLLLCFLLHDEVRPTHITGEVVYVTRPESQPE